MMLMEDTPMKIPLGIKRPIIQPSLDDTVPFKLPEIAVTDLQLQFLDTEEYKKYEINLPTDESYKPLGTIHSSGRILQHTI